MRDTLPYIHAHPQNGQRMLRRTESAFLDPVLYIHQLLSKDVQPCSPFQPRRMWALAEVCLGRMERYSWQFGEQGQVPTITRRVCSGKER